ncbi:MAG TPA: hypothetical protein VF941_13435 [Clostridia bacterium]
MQIKIFRGHNITNVEKQVNEFIKGKQIRRITQSETQTDNPKEWSLTITLLYDDVNSDDLYGGIGMEDDMKIEIVGLNEY